ncbi:GlcG/HbpS family heme-binding protein [Streptomyces sp. NPDC002577]
MTRAQLPHTEADHALRAALVAAAEEGLRVSVAVVDDRGFDVAVARGDGAKWFTPEVARAKARTAVSFGAPTASLAAMKEQYPELFSLIGEQLPSTPTTLPGGLPLVDEGMVIGAIGVSGARPEDDVRIAETGAAALRAARPQNRKN